MFSLPWFRSKAGRFCCSSEALSKPAAALVSRFLYSNQALLEWVRAYMPPATLWHLLNRPFPILTLEAEKGGSLPRGVGGENGDRIHGSRVLVAP